MAVVTEIANVAFGRPRLCAEPPAYPSRGLTTTLVRRVLRSSRPQASRDRPRVRSKPRAKRGRKLRTAAPSPAPNRVSRCRHL